MKYRDKEFLHKLYWEEQKSSVEIAKICGVAPPTIRYWMRKLGVPIRTTGAASHLLNGHTHTLSPDAKAFIEGELLGDGSICCASQFAAQYHHGSKHKEYLLWLAQQLSNWGIETSCIYRSGRNWKYSSKSYSCFLEMRRRWYPNGRKIVPEDLVLSPLTLRQFFLGDGNAYCSWPGSVVVRFATYSFELDEVQMLAAKIADALGVSHKRVYIVKHRYQRGKIGYLIHMGKRNVVRAFYEYIGPCPKDIEPIYGYKWLI